jgi:uncharacterized membrane-anchored protein YjiN (DUF445 family)
MGHKLKFTMEVGDNQLQIIKDKLPRKLYDELETQRELAIMREVVSSKGDNIIEKIGNTLNRWDNEDNTQSLYNNTRYKLIHRY